MSSDTDREPPTTERSRRLLGAVATIAGGLVVIVLLFIAVTAFVGFPGPGPLRRYPVDELQALADRINAAPRTPKGCIDSDPGNVPKVSAEPIARVDLVTSRVVVRRTGGGFGGPTTLLSRGEQDMLDHPIYMAFVCELS